jgi:hypothetical protein
MEVQHFSHEEHPLIFVEELENDGENEVVCSGCDKSVSGPAYRCSQSCTFFLHKPCAELPLEIQHPVHPNHNLVLVAPEEEDRTCDACLRLCNRCFAYQCHSCNFDLDIECASASWPTKRDDCHQHEFVPIFQEIQFTCKLCGEDWSGDTQVCLVCRHLAHTLCALKPRSIKLQADSHLVTLIYSLGKVFKEHDHAFCSFCGRKVNLKYAGYYCQQCDFVAHLKCAHKNSIEPSDTIKIMADRHFLTLIYSLGQVILKEHDDTLCNLCFTKVNLKRAGYYCHQCDFVAHLGCARKNSIEPIGITYSSDSSIESDVNEDIYLEEDEEREEVKRFYHEHKLILSRNEVEFDHRKLICEGCMQSISAPFYSCEQCHYFLHSTCARLPLKKRHPIHRHKLTLSATGDFTGGLSSCNACRRLSHGFAYVCHHLNCGYNMDIRCCSIPKIFKHEGHRHPLSFAKSSAEMCNACDSSERRLGTNGANYYGAVFVCNECVFAMDFECATLPLKVKCEYDPHHLSLTYTVENDSEEYYCLICEEERNTNHWFYYCVECNFAAHPRCAIGPYPYIKYETNFTQEDGHQHPFNFSWRTKNSHPCDACGKTFENKTLEGETSVGAMGLNCTQCKSIIHWDYKCIRKLEEKLLSTY